MESARNQVVQIRPSLRDRNKVGSVIRFKNVAAEIRCAKSRCLQ